MNIQPFTVHISDEALEDLKCRLSRTRWPDEIVDAEWDYGSNLAYIRELCDYWENEFDWRAQEAAINALPNYRTDVDGLGVHFIHVRGTGPNPIPDSDHTRLAEHVRRDAEDHPAAGRSRRPRRGCR